MMVHIQHKFIYQSTEKHLAHRVDFVPGHTADIAALREWTLVRPEAVKVGPQVSDDHGRLLLLLLEGG